MKDHLKRSTLLAVPFLAVLCLLTALATPANAQLNVSSADGTISGKFGILGQVTGETLDNADATHTAQDIYLRRIRFLAGFKLWDNLNIFFDTDSPNTSKGDGLGGKTAVDLYVQDFFATYTFAKEFQIDAGFMLPPNSYNHTESAAQLLAVDYGANSFLESASLQERVGRDSGVQARGYLADHLEYRLGVFQGNRSKVYNSFLFGGRLAYWIFGTQTGYTYRGTSLGKTQSLEIGGSYSKQNDYKSDDFDLFWDQPVNGGDGITLQIDHNDLDGGVFLKALPKQKNDLAELAYYIHGIKSAIYGQYTDRKFDVTTTANQTEKRYEIGWAWYPHGYNSNLKLGVGKIDRDTSPKRNQYRLQYQVYVF
jgi:Phosphate-selective porin O and P